MKILLLTGTMILFFICSMASAFADTDCADEPSRGRGELVGGIVTTSVGGGLGIAGLTYALFGCSSGEGDCVTARRNAVIASALVLGSAIPTGVYFIVSGAQQRRAWKTWRRECGPEQAWKDDAAAFPVAVGATPDGGLALSVTLSL